MNLEALKMNLKSLKSLVNNEKGQLIKGKITKSSMTFNENKPNLKNIKIGVSSCKTGKYEILTAWRSKNQTQSKPNSNPIYERPKMNARNALTINYEIFFRLFGDKTNPIQTQFNRLYLTNRPKFDNMVSI